MLVLYQMGWRNGQEEKKLTLTFPVAWHGQAFEANPGKGMMVEYPSIPVGIVDTVLPSHYQVEVTPWENERMMNATLTYSKVTCLTCDYG